MSTIFLLFYAVTYFGFCKGGPHPGVWGESPPAGSGVDFEANSKHFEAPLMDKKTPNQLPILNTHQTVACLGFGKGSKLRWSGGLVRERESSPCSVVQGAKPWKGVWGLRPPAAGELFQVYI